MKTIAFLALLLIVLAIPVGCAKQEETTEFHEVEPADDIDIGEIMEDCAEEYVMLTDEEIANLNIPEEYKNLDIYEEKEQMKELNANEHVSDGRYSNIPIDIGEVDVPLTDYPWLDVNREDYDFYEVYQWIGYAIKQYYNNDIKGVYSCNIPDDIIDEETNMIFTVRVHSSERPDLDIWLDLYKYKVIVEEVTKE